eukprot:scaffold224350_cov33-Prasinocladus_malaysianus.AAC.1
MQKSKTLFTWHKYTLCMYDPLASGTEDCLSGDVAPLREPGVAISFQACRSDNDMCISQQ